MAGEDRPGQVIEEFLTGLTPVALPLGLGRIVTLLGDLRGVTMGTGDALWGQRKSRTVSKHFTSSMRFWMLTIVRGLAIL